MIIQLTAEQNKITMWYNEKKSDSIYFYFFDQKHYRHQNNYSNLMQTLQLKVEQRTC